jgi:hypothetical protein
MVSVYHTALQTSNDSRIIKRNLWGEQNDMCINLSREENPV